MQCQPPVREWLVGMARALGKGAVVIEVGSWCGDTAKLIAPHVGLVICVDRFDGAHMGTPGITFWRWVNAVANLPIVGIVGESWEVPTLLPVAGDLVFIDADHTYTAVRRDILAWWPKVKDGGWLAGDDWNEEGVKAAVRETRGEPTVTMGEFGWAFRKPKD